MSAQPEPVTTAIYGPEAFARDVGADARAMADLTQFLAMIEDTNRTLNLVGDSTLPEFWSRHALDSAQLLKLAPNALTWADLGAGAGFPGVVLAILLKDKPGAQIHLIDSVGKRCRFLSEVVQALALPAQVHNARAEDLDFAVDVVTARALAPMSKLLGFAYPYFQAGAEGLFLKGQAAETELVEARDAWRFDAVLTLSLSDPRGRVVHIRSLRRVR